MRILVPVKQVARLADRAALDASGALPADQLEWEMNEWDLFSLEAAQRLIEGEGEGEVLVASIGSEPAEEVLRACLSKGADRAIRIWEPSLEGFASDPLAIAGVLAALAQREAPDLILCGAQSADAANAATGVALAGLLDMARVAVVTSIQRDGEGLRVARALEGGGLEVLGLELPALLTIQTGIHEPRHATLRAIKQARSKIVEVLDLGALGLDATSLAGAAGARTLRLLEPERTAGASMLDGEPEAIAARIAEIIARDLQA